MNEIQKKWVNTMCRALEGYLEKKKTITDDDWKAMSGFIDVIVAVSGNFKEEVRSELLNIVEKWEIKNR